MVPVRAPAGLRLRGVLRGRVVSGDRVREAVRVRWRRLSETARRRIEYTADAVLVVHAFAGAWVLYTPRSWSVALDDHGREWVAALVLGAVAVFLVSRGRRALGVYRAAFDDYRRRPAGELPTVVDAEVVDIDRDKRQAG
jgi:hypothetical protein